jgi:hypothetical protein
MASIPAPVPYSIGNMASNPLGVIVGQLNAAQAASKPAPTATTNVAPTATSGSTGGGGGDSTSTASTNSFAPNQFNSVLNNVQGLINQAVNYYNSAISGYGNAVSNQRSSLETNANDQANQLTTQYEYAAPQLQAMENARGIGDSSWAYREQQNAGDTYGQQMQQIGDQLNSNLTNLAGTAASNLGTWNATKGYLQNLNLGMYPQTDLGYYGLQNLQNDLAQQVPTAAGYAAQSQPGGTLLNQINSIAPSQVYNSQTLQNQLNTLSNSSAPQSALNQVASAAISSNNTANPGTSANWLQYWQNLTNPSS